ncbi:MAG: diacylglycerol kinase family protein [Clostridia bacterium]|nr:diacylglycerol kinase family protein [Clostridia bacterium]
MATGYVLFNEKAGNGRGKEGIEKLTAFFKDRLCYLDMTAPEGGYPALLGRMQQDDFLVLCGGDGTLNCFINEAGEAALSFQVWYFPTGSGNDFAKEFGKNRGEEPFLINDYLKDLPVVSVNGTERRFLNGVGYGIDGYCCEVGDELRAKSDKAVNYTAIAIKGLLFHYRPTKATVIVDGREYTYNKVWIAPTMKGRYYGGGMNPAPKQDRKDPEGKLSLTLFHGSGRLKTLMIFPSIFKGEHVKNEKYVTVLEGKEIMVRFDSPRALQIDGETVLNVTSYTACAGVSSKNALAKEETAMV